MFKDYESIQVGDTATLVRKITEADIKKFVEMTGDDNPLHVDRKYAETTPFKDIVVHGMLGASFISTIIGTQLPGTGALWMSQTLDFLLPVRLGDTLTVVCTVLKKNDRERMLELDTQIVNQQKQVVLKGQGKVKVLESKQPEAPKEPTQRMKVALVTGGAGGIGRATCLALAKQGFSVVVNYNSSEDRARETVQLIEAQGGKAIAVRGNVADARDATDIVGRTVRAFGGLSLLVNNAAPKISPKPFANLSWEDFQSHLDIQLKGAFLMTQACVPIMKDQGYGKIVSITSQVLDGAPTPTWTTYAVGKASLATYSRYLAAELGPMGITVNCVSPGMTDTGMIGDIPEKARLMIARQTPLRRLGSPQDVANAVAFLASDAADFITGETIRINGGQAML